MTTDETGLRERLAAPAADWVAEAAPAAATAGDHPGVDELIAYHAGGTAEAGRLRVQDHLVTCRQCLDHLLELDAFVRPESGGDQRPAANLPTAAAWRELQRRLPSGRPGARGGLPAWALAVAAVLVMAIAGLTLWTVGQRQELAGLHHRLAELSLPQPGAAVVDLFPGSELRGGEPAAAAELPAGAGYVTLIVNLPEPPEPGPPATRYELELLDAAGRPVWSSASLEASPLGTLRLGLPAGFLAPGEHTLRLYRRDGEGRHPVDSYTLRLPPARDAGP